MLLFGYPATLLLMRTAATGLMHDSSSSVVGDRKKQKSFIPVVSVEKKQEEFQWQENLH